MVAREKEGDLFMEWIDRAKQLKHERRMTNDELAELSGIPLGTLNKLLAKATTDPQFSTVIALASALGCSIDYLLGEESKATASDLSPEEDHFLQLYRTLDAFDRELVGAVIEKASARPKEKTWGAPVASPALKRTVTSAAAKARRILLYDFPVSAGTGAFLDSSDAEEIAVTLNDAAKNASFALRVSGDSMEPKFKNGDIILVEEQPSVQMGELGIFVLDGEGYFKRYGGDRLISLNRAYDPIPLAQFDDIRCVGRVVGRMKRP